MASNGHQLARGRWAALGVKWILATYRWLGSLSDLNYSGYHLGPIYLLPLPLKARELRWFQKSLVFARKTSRGKVGTAQDCLGELAPSKMQYSGRNWHCWKPLAGCVRLDQLLWNLCFAENSIFNQVAWFTSTRRVASSAKLHFRCLPFYLCVSVSTIDSQHRISILTFIFWQLVYFFLLALL